MHLISWTYLEVYFRPADYLSSRGGEFYSLAHTVHIVDHEACVEGRGVFTVRVQFRVIDELGKDGKS